MTCAQTAVEGLEREERSFTGTALRCHFRIGVRSWTLEFENTLIRSI